MMRSRTRSGVTIIELTIVMGILAVLVSLSAAFVATNTRQVTLNEDRSFAVQKATMMLSELRGVAEQPGTQAADTLDSYDDGADTSNILCVDTSVVDPAHVLSQNASVGGGRWRYARRVTVRKFPSLNTRDVRIVTVRVFLTSAAQQDDTVLADVTSVINTVATAYPPSQVYDTYLLAMENVPGWWVYMSYIKPFIENSLDDMEARQPGLVFRRHWITKLGFGRDPLYQPYFNKAADSNAVINSVYFYPGTMPAGSAVDQYYVPDNVKARINVDGATKNGYNAATNPWPYALADQFNHCARQPVEQALFNQRLAAGQEAADTLTWHLLLDDMIKNPNNYRNAIFINLHGELVPFPPVRNYSDAAKEPTGFPNARVVTHPQKLCFSQTDPLVLRVYAYNESAGAWTTTAAGIAAGALTITVASTTGFPTNGQISIESNLVSYTGTSATTFTGCTGAVAHVPVALNVYQVPASSLLGTPVNVFLPGVNLTTAGDVTVAEIPGGADKEPSDNVMDGYATCTAPSTAGAGSTANRMYAQVSYVAAPPGTKILLYNTPLTCPNTLAAPGTVTTAAIVAGAATISVSSTSAFPTSGQVSLEGNCICYTGTTATSFTGCTGAVAHLTARTVTLTSIVGYTTTTAAILAGAATITVASTAAFPPSGRVSIEGNLISYTGITATTFAGCTGAIAHATARTAFLEAVSATTTTAANAAAATTISVASTSGFPSSGAISVEGNVITYTGMTGTSFTGCLNAVAHASGVGVNRPVVASTNTSAAVLVGAASISVLSTALFPPSGQLSLESNTSLPTSTTVAIVAGAATITVSSTASYPTSGQISIEGNLITYTGKTLTTFTGCTGAVAHATARAAYLANIITYTGITATTFTGCTGSGAHATGVTVYLANTGLNPAWRLYGDDYVPCSTDAATTVTSAAVAAGAATVTVSTTTGFPTSGQISLEGNLITYTGTTLTTFTGCVGAIAHVSGATVDFCTNLVTAADKPNNTARWVITISKAALDRAENLGAGTERLVPIETRLGTGLTAGTAWPVANQPSNLSTTYAWRSNNTLYAANQTFVPFSERYQFQGDPRDCPYSDVKAGHGYNWYFDNMRDANINTRLGPDSWPGFDTAKIRNTNGSDFDGWHGSGTNGTLADSNEIDVPRHFQWMRNGLCTSNSIYTTLTGFSYYYMGNGNEIGYDSANGFLNSIPTNPKPFTGVTGLSRNEMSITDAQTGGVKLIRESVSNYWWSKPWVGELYPDTMAATWATTGNLPTGNTANTFVRIRRMDIVTSGAGTLARAGSLPRGTTFSDHRTLRRLNAKGCTSFFNIGTATATFRHEYRDGTTGNLSTGGNELDATYNFPVPSNTKISRPFRLDYNTTTDEFSQAEYLASRASASNLLVYYAHQDITPPWNGSALIREQLLASDGTSPSCFIAVNGIDRTVETGSAFIATWSGLTLIHTFLSSGLPATQSRVTELPQIVIKQPNDSTELKNPATVTIQWSSSWFRWDGLPYTPQYPVGFTENDAVLRYALLYSLDNGQTWRHIVDNSPATPGTPNQTLLVADWVAGGDETYIWDVVGAVYLDEASYLIRVEAYRSTIPTHYSFHQQKIFISR